jgi:hypothetical protein
MLQRVWPTVLKAQDMRFFLSRKTGVGADKGVGQFELPNGMKSLMRRSRAKEGKEQWADPFSLADAGLLLAHSLRRDSRRCR